jgi:hypothetical protein
MSPATAQFALDLAPLIAPPQTDRPGAARPASPTGPDLGRAPGNDPLDAGSGTVGFRLGWDHARFGVVPPTGHLDAASPIRRGWESGRGRFRGRPRPARPADRAWLDLRLQAWMHGIAFDELHVTPHYLEQLRAPACPVQRADGACADDGTAAARIVPLGPAEGYAPGNLVALSDAAATALQRLGRERLLARALGSGGDDDHGDPDVAETGLPAPALDRLAVLLSLAMPLRHEQAAGLPLLVLPPNRLRVVNPVQGLQLMLTGLLGGAGYARQMTAIAARLPDDAARRAFYMFMHALLARRLELGRGLGGHDLQQGLEDAWRHPRVNQHWRRLALRLTAAQCQTLLDWGLARPGIAQGVRGPKAGRRRQMAAWPGGLASRA